MSCNSIDNHDRLRISVTVGHFVLFLLWHIITSLFVLIALFDAYYVFVSSFVGTMFVLAVFDVLYVLSSFLPHWTLQVSYVFGNVILITCDYDRQRKFEK